MNILKKNHAKNTISRLPSELINFHFLIFSATFYVYPLYFQQQNAWIRHKVENKWEQQVLQKKEKPKEIEKKRNYNYASTSN